MRDYSQLKSFLQNYNFNKDDYKDLILEIGLSFDSRGKLVYGDDIQYMRKDTEGMWQIVEEINSLLLLLKTKSINSFLEVGTYKGYTFLIIDSLLKFKNKNCFTQTIDLYNHINDSFVKTFNINYEFKKTSSNFKDSTYDLVFIDADHSYEQSKQDFLNVGIHSKICVFHDINDDFVKNSCKNGGVPRLWNELKLKYKHTEIIKHPNNLNVMGIGVLYINES